MAYDDNLELSTTDKTPAYRFSVIPQLLARRETERSALDLDLSVFFERYSGAENRVNRKDPELRAAYRYAFSQAEIGVSALATRQSTLASEFEDTGRGSVDESQDTLEFAGFWRYELDERNTLRLSGSVRDVSYTTDTLTDYVEGQVDLELSSLRTPRWLAFGHVSAERYRPGSGQSISAIETDAYLLGIGSRYAVTELLDLELALDLLYADQPGLHATDWLGALGVHYNSGLMSIGLDASKTVFASGVGSLREQNLIAIGLTRGLSERIVAGVAASWREGRGGGTESKQTEFDSWLEWQWSETVALRASYTLRRQFSVDEAAWATSNSVELALRYIPQR